MRNRGDLATSRVYTFEAIYGLASLRKLAMFEFASLDVARFRELKTLFVRDAPGLVGTSSLVGLRTLRIWNQRSDDLAFVASLRNLDSLWLARPAMRVIRGLGASASLRSLEIHHASKLEGFESLPASLASIRIDKCRKFADTDSLASAPGLRSVYVEKLPSLRFVREMKRLDSISFGNVVDGDLGPLLESRTLESVHFYPERKSYSHSLGEVRDRIGSRARA